MMRPCGLSKTTSVAGSVVRPLSSGTSSVPARKPDCCAASGAAASIVQRIAAIAAKRGMAGAYSALPLCTIESRAAGLHDALDAAAAIATGTGRALVAVDRPLVLEIAELAGGLDVILKARPAGGDGAGQHLADRHDQPFGARARHRRGEAARRQPGPIERLGDIDIAETGDDTLVEQRRFDRRHLAGKRGGQARSVEFVAERLRPDAGEQRMRRQRRLGRVVEQPEAPGVVEADDGA